MSFRIRLTHPAAPLAAAPSHARRGNSRCGAGLVRNLLRGMVCAVLTVTLYTYEWLPEFPRGFVRDMRVRWALEELGQPYTVATVPVHPKTDAHRAMQPFGQVPMIEDGDLRLFESGAIVLHLADGSPLLPPARRAEVTQWLIAALNSIEPSISAWVLTRLAEKLPQFFGPPSPPEVVENLRKNMNA